MTKFSQLSNYRVFGMCFVGIMVLILWECRSLSISARDHSRLNRELVERIEDKSIVLGKTENGTSYYIKDHSNSEEKILVALIIDAGSVLEEDDQLGLAHFVEHMAFNGTETFPGNEIIDMLQKEGVRFGPDLNASTSYDFTRFYISIPADKSHLLPLSLDIVEEWLHHMTYGEEEIEKEKGVVLEEVRAFEQPRRKAFTQMWEYLHEGTPFHNRNPGGKMDVIESASREVIKSFYDVWYRPDLAAVSVIGDLDTESVEKEILSRFRYAVDSSALPEHPAYDFPLEPPGQFLMKYIPIDDPQASSLGMIAYRQSVPEDKREGLWADLIETFSLAAFNYRMDQVIKKSSYLKSAGMMKFSRGRTGSIKLISFEPRPGLFLEGFKEIVDETEKLLRWGITTEDFHTVIAQYINYFRGSPRVNSSWLGIITEHFIYRDLITDEEKVIEVLEEIMAGKLITVEDVNLQFKGIGLQSGIRFAALHPSNETLASESEFIEYYRSSSSFNLEKNASPDRIVSLIGEEVKSQIREGEVSRSSQGEGHSFRLQNGVKVYYQPLTTSEKNIFLYAIGHNPDSIKYIGDKKSLFNFDRAAAALSWARMGGYHYQQLENFYNAHSLNLNISLNGYSKNIGVRVSRENLEMGFQALYLAFTDLHYDREAAEYFRNAVADDIQRLKESDSAYLTRNYNTMVYPDNPYNLRWEDDRIENFDPELAHRILQESLKVSDFTFYITGDIEVEELSQLLKKYLASLPATGNPASANLTSSGLTSQKENTLTYQRGKGQSVVLYGWTEETNRDPSLKERILCALVGEALTIELLKEIREKEAGVYSITGMMFFNLYPRLITELRIMFSTKQERTRELIEKSQAIVERFSRGEIDGEVMTSARKTLATTYEEFKNDLSGYAHMMYKLNEYGEDPFRGYRAYLETLAEVEDEEVFTYLREHLRDANYFQIIQDPL